MKSAFYFLMPVIVTTFVGLPAFADNKSESHKKESSHSQKSSESSKTIPKPEDCENVRSGTAGAVTEAAAEKDCKASRHLGAGSGTSSGTGSGKMGPGQGPR